MKGVCSYLSNGDLEVLLYGGQPLEGFFGLGLFGVSDLLGVLLHLILEDLDSGQSSFGNLLILIQHSTPNVVNVYFLRVLEK